MGLLDDAIREHLDLKRRRGADPAEVERAEREALGPVRRNRDPGEPIEPADEIPTGDAFAYDQDDDDSWDHEEPTGADLPADRFADPPAGPADAGPSRAADAPPARPRSLREEGVEREDWSAADEEDFDRAPFPADPEPPSRIPELSDETAEYDVEEALAGGPHAHETDDEDEDVLEETPEFLQDTPDHDRLWFEQRPPRDFDFDG